MKIKRTTKKKIKEEKTLFNIKAINYNLLFVFTVIFFALCGLIYGLIKNSGQSEYDTVNIYYFDPASSSLKQETRPISLFEGLDDKEKRKEIITFVLEELSIGPKNLPLVPSVPPDLIKSAKISGTNVDVEVSEQYNSLLLKDELICRSAISYTLTSLDFVETVTININGYELKKPNGSPFGQIEKSDIVLEPNMTHLSEKVMSLSLYFANEDGTGLQSEKRTVLVNLSEPIAKYIVEELIKGPHSDNLTATIPAETVLRDISMSDGICYVDLSKEFITKHPDTMLAELSVYSIVNSLTEQSDIKNVQFYIEGERLEIFKTISDFSNLFGANPTPLEEPK